MQNAQQQINFFKEYLTVFNVNFRLNVILKFECLSIFSNSQIRKHYYRNYRHH
jgi:hypothetical protein